MNIRSISHQEFLSLRLKFSRQCIIIEKRSIFDFWKFDLLSAYGGGRQALCKAHITASSEVQFRSNIGI